MADLLALPGCHNRCTPPPVRVKGRQRCSSGRCNSRLSFSINGDVCERKAFQRSDRESLQCGSQRRSGHSCGGGGSRMRSNSKSRLPVSRNFGGGGDESESLCGDVYVASMALKVPNGPARWVLQAADAIGVGDDFHHFMTIVQPPGEDNPCTVLDFQPRDPEDPMSAVAVLMGRTIPGVVQERPLSRLPRTSCWWVGKMKPGLDVEDALAFNRRWNTELNLGINDCRHHTLDLVEYLTGNSMSHIEEVRIFNKQEPVGTPEGEFEENVKDVLVEDSEGNLVQTSVQKPVEIPVEFLR